MLNEYMSNEAQVSEKKYFKLSGCRYISKEEYAKIMQPTTFSQIRINNHYWLKRREEIADVVVRTVAFILACIFIITFVPKLVVEKIEEHKYKTYIEQSTEYIHEMEYNKAIKILEKGLKLKTVDNTEFISQIGYLYGCVGEYDKGISFLQQEYKVNNAPVIYDRMEELKTDKAIEKYNEYLSIADDGNHLITEDDRLDAYTKAIDAKPDESKAYLLVSNIYAARGEYDKAINILASGVETCLNTRGQVARQTLEVLNSEINKLDKILNSTEYNEKYLAVCRAYIKGDLDTAILKYKEAKEINHRDYRLYVAMANTYTRDNKYDEAIGILNEGIKVLSVYKNNSLMVGKYDNLVNLRTKIGKIKKYVNSYSAYYKNLYSYCEDMAENNNILELEKCLNTKTYKTMATVNNVTYYNALGKFVDRQISGLGLAVYKNQYLYYGNWKNGKKHGRGHYIASTKKDGKIITYIYSGSWLNDYPNGKGIVQYSIKKKGKVIYKTVTSGSFVHGYENGKMKISKYDKANYGNKTVTLNYTAKNGVLQYIKDKKGKIQKTSSGDKIIGYYYVGNKKSEVVATKKTLIWKVNGL
ncbi:MAG: hypothetical protein E7262_08350 [Lachnospiraceae bacterium]|nr:hypothetical protein [Lachnospiraceae bacterium]